jgi:hypothetical protein
MKRRSRPASDSIGTADCLLMMKMQAAALRDADLDEVMGAIVEQTRNQDSEAELFPGVLFGKAHPLCSISSVPYKEDTDESIQHNAHIGHTFGAIEEVGDFWKPATMTRHVNMNGTVALTAYIEACDAYKPSEIGGAAHLDFGGKVQILGGWAKAYSPVNCTPSQADQQRSVFHITAGKLNQLRALSPAYNHLATSSEALVRQLVVAEDDAKEGAGLYKLATIDILFQHSRSVHFTNHRDTEASSDLVKDLVVTVVWLISPNGGSSLRVAGANDAAMMEGPGAGHMLVSDMFHRTDVTTTGTVKVTCFFQRPHVKPAKASAKAVKAAASKAAPPQETKEEEEKAPLLQPAHVVNEEEESSGEEEEKEEGLEDEEEEDDGEEDPNGMADEPALDTYADAAEETEKGEHASAVQTLPAAICAAQSTNAEGGDELGAADEAPPQMADTPTSAEEAETA